MAKPSGGKVAFGVVTLAVLLGVLGWFFFAAPPPPAARVEPAQPGGPREPPSTAAGRPPAAAPTTTAMAPAGETLGPLALLNPAATVSTEVRLLAKGEDAAFRETLLPALRDHVSAKALAACRQRIASEPVQPDWEKAEDATVDGSRVQRVAMWGKAKTGFHEVGGKWLADALWCAADGPQ